MLEKGNILLAEDEESLRNLVAYNLREEGYDVAVVENGQKAIDVFSSKIHDLVVLDVMMPIIDGFEVCRRIREKDNNTPILFLTSKNFAEDRVHGLKIGADDYITKPFNLEELLLRVEKLIKRKANNIQATAIRLGKATVRFAAYEIECDGKRTTIPTKEMDLLRLLYENRNKVVARNEILDELWGGDAFPTSRTIDNYILSLRKLIEKNPKSPEIITSIRGVGYKLVN